MNRILKSVLGLMVVTTIVVSCASPTSPGSSSTTTTPASKAVAKSIALPAALSVAPGTTGKITPILPASTTAPTLTWSIPKAVAGFSVSQDGVVTVAATATVGSSAKVQATYTSSVGGFKSTLTTVVTAQKPPIGATKAVVTVASTPVTKAVTGTKTNKTISVPASTKIGSKGVKSKMFVGGAITSLPAADLTAYRSLVSSLSRVSNTRNQAVTALTPGTAASLWPAANGLIGALSSANDEATELSYIGMLVAPSTWDPTAANVPTTQTVTFDSTTLPSTNPLKLATNTPYSLTDWDFYTLSEFESDGKTANPYYELGYSNEISWKVGTTSYWIDFTDDGTQVQVEIISPDSTTAGATDDLVVETNFNLSTQSFSYYVTNADGVSGTADHFQLTYDDPTVGASGYLDAEHEVIDASGDSINSTIVSGYFDDKGAFITGSNGDPRSTTDPIFVYETVDANGGLVDQGILTETNGVVATSNQTGTDDPSVAGDANTTDGGSNYYWKLLF